MLLIFSQLNASYTFAKKYEAERDENNDVPKFLHFLWVFQPIPEKYLEAISAFEKHNPKYEVRKSLKNIFRPKQAFSNSWIDKFGTYGQTDISILWAPVGAKNVANQAALFYLVNIVFIFRFSCGLIILQSQRFKTNLLGKLDMLRV